MADRVSQGTARGSQRDPLNSARVVNDILAAKDDYIRRRALGVAGRGVNERRTTNEIKFLNSSGAALPAGSVVEIVDGAFTQLQANAPWVAADVSSGDRTHGIALEPTPDGKIGWMQVSGHCMAWVDVSDEDHYFCSPASGELNVQSGDTGDWPIIWKPTGTGSLWCLILLDAKGTGGPPSCVLWQGEAYNQDFSTSANLVYVSNGHVDNRWCYLFWDKAWGDLAGTSINAINTTSTPSSWDDPSFETAQAGLYRFQLRLTLACDTAKPSPDTDQLTTSTVSGHSHTVDVPYHYAFYQQFGVILEHKDGAAAWTNSFEDNYYPGYVNGSSLTYGDASIPPMVNATWWHMHNYPGRRYRIMVWMTGAHPTDTLEASAWSPILQVTRLGDYAADQTL